MVAIITHGESVRGILNYNENKVKEGKAQCLKAEGFGCEANELTFSNKWHRFRDLVGRRKDVEINAVHITLNFEPGEKLSSSKLSKIADEYMNGIGFGDQPYIVYKHDDAGHPHLHIATCIITSDAKRIETHLLGKLKSEPTRKKIEKDFGLVEAESKAKTDNYVLKPIELEKLIYGEKPTKGEISNRVRTVFNYYKFGSFDEFKAILKSCNILADLGEPGTIKFQKGGLTYSVLNEKDEKIGVPIKASTIYDRPILGRIYAKCEDNLNSRKDYKGRVSDNIEAALAAGVTQQEFVDTMKQQQTDVIFHKNEEGRIFGISFIDHKTRCYFKGSELDRKLNAKGITDRFVSGYKEDIFYNRELVPEVLSNTNFKDGISQVMAKWAVQGIIVTAKGDGSGKIQYRMGHILTDSGTHIPVSKKMQAYFFANKLSAEILQKINMRMEDRIKLAVKRRQSITEPININDFSQKLLSYFVAVIDIMLSHNYLSNSLPHELLKEAKKRKKRKG